MPDVISTAPADVRLWVALDVHKFSIVAAVLPPSGGRPEVTRIETTEKAIRRSERPGARGGDQPGPSTGIWLVGGIGGPVKVPLTSGVP